MNLQNSSTIPVCLGDLPHMKMEQSLSNMDIKMESLDLTDNDSSGESAGSNPENIVEPYNNESEVEASNESSHPVNHDTLVKPENSSEYESGVTFLSIDSLKSCQNIGSDRNETRKPKLNVNITPTAIQPLNVDLDATSLERSSSIFHDSDDPLSDSILLEDNTFACSICSFTTDKKSRLSDHERHHRKTNLPIFQCIYCSQKYTRYMLYLHVQSVHPGQKFQIRDEKPKKSQSGMFYKCSTCSFSTNKQNEFSLHMKEHLPEVAGEGTAKNSGRDESSLELEPAEEINCVKEYSASQTALQCSYCSFSANEKSMLMLHMKIHLESIKHRPATDQKVLECRLCSYISPNISTMYDHIKSHKNNKAIQKCFKCNFKSTPKALFFHMKKCRRKSKFASEENPSSISKDASQQGMQKLHGESDLESSKEIAESRDAPEQTMQELHMQTNIEPITRTSATGQQIFECRMCSYSNKSMWFLNNHIHCHKKNRPITKCVNCDFKSTPKVLSCHMKRCRKKSRSTKAKCTPKEITDQNYKEVMLKPPIKLKLKMKDSLFEPVKRLSASGRTMYHCKMCSYGCTKLVVTLAHINSHKNNLPIIKCSYCSFKSTSRAVKHHMRNCKVSAKSVHTKDVFSESEVDQNAYKSCAIVVKPNRSFSKTEKDPSVLYDSSGKKIYKCWMCSYGNNNRAKVICHSKSHEGNLPIIRCTFCNFKSTSRVMKYHFVRCRKSFKAVNESKSQFSCPQCSFSTSLRIKLKFHTKKHHSVSNMMFSCNCCSFSTAKTMYYEQHLKGHDRNLPIKKCPYCSFKSTLSVLRRHIEKCNKDQDSSVDNSVVTLEQSTKIYKCKRCSLVANKSQDYCSHMKCDTDVEEVAEEQNKLDKIDETIEQNKQVKIDKTIEARNKSNKTGTTSYSQNTLTKVYKCRLCSFVTCKALSLCNHMTSHTHKRPITKCPGCNFKSTPKSLKRHMLSEKHFQDSKCKLCSVTCATYRQLTLHMRSHNSNKPIIKCPNCDFRSTSCALKRHKCDEEESNAADEVEDKKTNESKSTPNFNIKKSLFRCSECWFFTSLRIKLKCHIKKCHQKVTTKSDNCYKCSFCSYATVYKHNCERHELTHLHPKKVTDNKCKKRDIKSTYFELKLHSQKCKGNQTEENRICLKYHESASEKYSVFNNNSSKVSDERNDSTTESLQDLLQNKSSANRDHSFQKVRNSNSTSQKIISCSFCPYTSLYKHNFKKHMQTAHLNQLSTQKMFKNVYRCNVCNFITLYEGKLSEHKENEKHYSSYILETDLNGHFDYNKNSVDSRLKDRSSKNKDSQKDAIKEDWKSRTTNKKCNKVYKCTSCAFSSPYKMNLTRHKRLHVASEVESSSSQPVIVSTDKSPCKKDRTDRSEIISKINQKNSSKAVDTEKSKLKVLDSDKQEVFMTSPGVYGCSICSYTSASRTELHEHREAHAKNLPVKQCHKGAGPKSFKCEYCSFTSFWGYLIERHMNSHTLLKLPIQQCSRCEFRSTPAALSAHINICNKKSNLLSNVSTNSPSSKKVKLLKNNVAKSRKSDYNTIKISGNRIRSGATGSPEAGKANRLDSSKDGLEKRNQSKQSVLTASSEGCENTEVNSSLEMEKPLKTTFSCTKCSFSTNLRLKLKVHLEKKH